MSCCLRSELNLFLLRIWLFSSALQKPARSVIYVADDLFEISLHSAFLQYGQSQAKSKVKPCAVAKCKTDINILLSIN